MVIGYITIHILKTDGKDEASRYHVNAVDNTKRPFGVNSPRSDLNERTVTDPDSHLEHVPLLVVVAYEQLPAWSQSNQRFFVLLGRDPVTDLCTAYRITKNYVSHRAPFRVIEPRMSRRTVALKAKINSVGIFFARYLKQKFGPGGKRY